MKKQAAKKIKAPVPVKDIDQMTDEEAQARIEELKRKKLQIYLEWKEHQDKYRIEYFKPYWYQEAVTNSFRKGANIVVQPLSNKVGKTTIGACLVHSWANGYEPWNPVPDTYEGAVRVGDRFYMPSSLGIKPPVDIRITSEDWEQLMANVIVPEMKKWARPGEYEMKKNNVGVEANWTHKRTGSTFNLMTYKQDPDLYESWLGQGWWGDEPPNERIWSGMSRGLFLSGGKVFLSMTPLKEPWIWDNLILSERPDVAVIKDVSLWDCPHLYDPDVSTLMKCGFTKPEAIAWLANQKAEARYGKEMPESDRMLKEKTFLKHVEYISQFGETLTLDAYTYATQNLKIFRFIRDLEKGTELIPRVFGEPKYLLGRCLPSFDKEVHVVKFSKPRPNWVCSFQIDWHPSENQAISFIAADERDDWWVFYEVWAPITNPEDLADYIIRVKEMFGLTRMKYGEIEALAKGDTAYVKNIKALTGDSSDTFTKVEKKLMKYGITLGTGSRDESGYIAATETRLKGPNNRPTLYIMDNCMETIRQLQRWVYDDNGKPSPTGHFGETIGRFTQMATKIKYTDPERWNKPLTYASMPI